MELTSGKIIKVLTKEGILVHNQMWMQYITYFREDMICGRSAELFYDSNTRVMVTSSVVVVGEDENNLVLTTQNSIYHIKKFNKV